MELHGYVTELEQKLKDQEKTIKLLQKKESLTNKTQNSSYDAERHIHNSMDPNNQNQQINQNCHRIDSFNIYERMHHMEIQALESRIRAIEVQSTQNLSICSALTTQMALQIQQSPHSFQQHPNVHLFPQPPAYQFTRPPPNIQHTRQPFPPHYNVMHQLPQANILNSSNSQRNDRSHYAASSTKTPHPTYHRQNDQMPKNLSDDSRYQEKPVQKELNKAKSQYKSDQMSSKINQKKELSTTPTQYY
ncbi:unnamed protein product [Mytilus coruscus]|uniref:Uncharacterized protein n=1 Tax=Mytilus coruscus TaxID=42192 RepID=A0A6J8C483_MYTCO|nr:unnamed protein product [Mytilus coruscus]